MKKFAGRTLFIGLLVCLLNGKAAATENNFSQVFTDGIYGGLAGALVGGAALAFQDDPGDHLKYLSYGAAIGVIIGTTFGLVSASRSMAEIGDHRMVFHLPVPEIAAEPGAAGRGTVKARVNFLTVRYW